MSGNVQVQQQIQRIPQRIMIWMWSLGAEGQNGTDTLDSNAEDNGEGTKYSNNSGRNSSSEQDDADTKDENNTKNNISGTKENAGNNAENSGASGDSVYNYNGKKKLTWPVMGNIILPYSMDATVYYTTLDQYACNDGIIVGAKVGEEVVSPANGRVVNIEDTDRYGKVVTILLGNYYKAYCGQLDNVDYEIGDDIPGRRCSWNSCRANKVFCIRRTECIF